MQFLSVMGKSAFQKEKRVTVATNTGEPVSVCPRCRIPAVARTPRFRRSGTARRIHLESAALPDLEDARTVEYFNIRVRHISVHRRVGQHEDIRGRIWLFVVVVTALVSACCHAERAQQ